MSRTTLSLTCVLWLTLMGVASAQSSVNDPGMATIQDFSGGVTLGGTYFNVYHLSGDGVGYRNGFTQIGTMSPWWVNENVVLASNNRLLITDTQQVGGNLGLLARYLDPARERIFGVNAYWDIDQSVYDNHYRQVGIGLETLGQWWDFRANGYFATTDSKNFLGGFAVGDDLTYWQHRVGFLGLGQYENAHSGGDWEFGVPLTPVTPWLRGYAGMYYYDAKANTPIGFRGRIEGWVADDLQLGVQVTQDRQYGTNVNASVNFQFAGFRPTRWFPNFTTQERMLNPVQRNWRVATGKFEQVDFVPAINPRTNQPYFIDWVDNSQLLAGNGTYEHPFNYLPNSAPDADLILVRVGDTTAIAPLSGSIVLSDYQRMLGEGREHEIRAYANYGAITTPEQTYLLPEFTNTGLYPYLTSNGDIITLANHNEVSAFNLLDANGRAITNTASGSFNYNVNYLNVRDNDGGGIILANATGGGLYSHINALNNAAGGIGVNSGNGPLFLSFQDVTSNSVPAGNQLFGIAAGADDGPIIAEFNNVTTDGNTTFGIQLTEFNTGLQATLTNVTASGNGDAGLRAEGVGASLDLTLANVNTSNNAGRGIYVTGNDTDLVFNYTNLSDSGNGNDNINFTLRNGSTLSGGELHDVNFDDSVAGSGIVFDLDASQVGSVLNPFDIVNVTASRNGANGLTIIATGGSIAVFSVDNSSFNGNDGDGISVTEFGDSVVRMLVDPTFILDNGRDGFHFNINDGSALTTIFAADFLAGNSRSAFYGEVDLIGSGGSTVNMLINDTLARDSGADGMRIISANNATVNIEANHSSFSNSGQTTAGSSGIRFDAVDSAIDLSLYNTPVQNVDVFPTGPQAFGLQLNLNDTDFVGTIGLASFSNNLQNGILANLSNNSNASLTMTDVTVDGSGADGLKAVVETGSDLSLTATTSSFSNNGLGLGVEGSGLNLSVTGIGGSAHGITANLRNVQIDANARHGILGSAAANSFLSLTMRENSTVTNNGFDGLNVTATDSAFIADLDTASFSNNRSGLVFTGAGAGPAISSITINNSAADNNAVDGMRFNVSGGHDLLFDVRNSSFSSNGQFGIIGDVSGAGTIVEINPFRYVLGNFNGAGGLDLHVSDEAFLNANINGGSFGDNGSNGIFDGVRVAVDSAGHAIVCFDGTAANSNTGDGYDFSAVDAGSRIDVALQTSGQFGTLQANSNGGQAVRFFIGPGASGSLFLEGDNQFVGNGQSPPVTFVVNGAAQAAFSFSGTVDGSSGDGVNVQMTDVGDAYIDIHDGTLTNNAESGIDISLNNVTFGTTPLTINFLQGELTANPFRIENMTIESNGEEGIKIVGTDVIMPVGVIYNNSIQGNGTAGAFDGIFIDISGASVLSDFSIGNDAVADSGNDINVNSRNGINVQLHDTSEIHLNIQGNNVIANSLNNIRVDLPDQTVAELHIDNNNVDGDGVPSSPGFNIGLNFTASQFSLFDSGEPPDTMGAVGPDSIVELLNDGYRVYDKSTGQLLFSSSDEAFWTAAGGSFLGQDVFDHRIIYDPTVDRWFATTITRGTNGINNSILVAVSNTSDPLEGFSAVQFDGDVEGGLFVDFDMLGIDADGLYISTNNFDASGVFQDVSIFSIPKDDLLSGFPSIADMTRFENLDSATVGFSVQPVVDFGPSDGRGALLSADYYSVANGRLVRTDVLNSDGAAATLSASTETTGVPNFTFAPLAEQPGGLLDSGGDRINGNVVEVNGRIWAVHAVQGTLGGSAVRWYEIDEATNAVLQTGLIQDANLDFFMPSVAVNPDGEVVIGMSASGPSDFAGSYAAFGTTTGGVTTFQTPTVLQAGSDTYFGSRWGDYSATVVDPSDPDTFWTFQEIATGPFNYATQITQITVESSIPLIGQTTNDGIQVTVRDGATLLNSTINNNISSANDANGIHVTLRDSATMNVLNIDGNTTNENEANGILFETPAGTPTINNFLTVNGPGDASNNGASGINVQLNNVLGTPSVIIDGTLNDNGQPARTVNDNGAAGINFVANNTPINFLVIANNTVDPNQGPGINAVLTNSQSNTVTIEGNRISENVGDGINLEFVNSTSVNTINLLENFAVNNAGEGIDLRSTNTTIGALNIIGNQIALNTGNGVNLVLDGAPVTTLTVEDNFIGLTQGNQSGFIDDSLPVIRNGFDSNVLAENDDGSTGLVPIGFDINFFGELFAELFVNNNGNVTFDSPLGTFTPFPIVTNGIPMFAPFFADVDTRGAGEEVTYGNGTIAGRDAFGVNWVDVDYFSGDHPDQLNSFQLIFIDRSDVNPGDFDFEFNYGQILWETGDASGGTDGLGGSSARVGFTNGTTNSLEFAGSAVNGALLDSGPAATSLIQNSLNSVNLGRYLFAARNGGIGQGGGPNGEDGVHIELTNGSDIGSASFDGNNISNNGGDGIDFNVVENSNIGPVVISNNTIDENTGDGIRLVTPNTANNTLDLTLTDNTSISGNDGNGVNLEIDNGEQLSLTMTGNIIGTADLPNAGMGVRAVINDNSVITADIGDSAASANTFGGNGDAGFGLVMSDTATGSLNVVNSSFNGSVDGTDANFAGVGLGVILQNDASLTQLHVGDATLQNTNFNENASHGFSLRMTGTSTIGGQTQLLNIQANDNGGAGAFITLTDAASLPDLLVTGTADGSSLSGNAGDGFFLSTNSSAVVTNVLLQDVTASENTSDGLQFVRQGASRILTTTIDNATVSNNAEDGIDLSAADNDNFDTYLISDSTISDNGSDGISLLNIGDADLDVTVTRSTITGNSGNGIFTTFNADVTDTPVLLLEVTDSTLNTNLLNGISITSNHFAFIDNNTISGNTQDGINISGNSAFSGVFDQITNNTISGNGDDGVDLNSTVLFANVDNNTISGNTDDGVVMDSNSGAARQVVTVNGNDILASGGDSVQITARAGSGTLGNPNQYFVTDNLIADSGQRGINVVNAGGTNGQGGTAVSRTVTELTIADNDITRSGLEAIYVINTASNTQADADNVDNLASDALLADGSVFAMPRLDLVIDNNDIDSSGQTQDSGNFIGSTGVVIRVGTSDASTSFSDNGGFANSGRGGVIAEVTDNSFSGNFGSDVTFHPFISTVPPADTVGEWTDQNETPPNPANDEFRVDSYQSDPLARLDLTFTGNTGNGLFATNPLAASAFYNNAEDVFKSRTTAQDPGTNNGPFNSGTRARNATRQALRGGAFTAPAKVIIGSTGQVSSTFLYPGVGASTFRVQGGPAFANSGGAGGNVFTTVFSDFSDSVSIGGDVGELPFVWGSF